MKALLLVLIRFYRLCISPLFPPICRFSPTCSSYALIAIDRHGPLRGSYLTLRRLLRCHPWGGSGYDPVPPLWTELGKTTLEEAQLEQNLDRQQR